MLFVIVESFSCYRKTKLDQQPIEEGFYKHILRDGAHDKVILRPVNWRNTRGLVLTQNSSSSEAGAVDQVLPFRLVKISCDVFQQKNFSQNVPTLNIRNDLYDTCSQFSHRESSST